jgi:hypothetical protein
MPRCRPTGPLAAMLAEAEAEIIAELATEEAEKRARRTEISRANLQKARLARELRHGQQPQGSIAPAAHSAASGPRGWLGGSGWHRMLVSARVVELVRVMGIPARGTGARQPMASFLS